jgi:DnaJ-class molecular chaperone
MSQCVTCHGLGWVCTERDHACETRGADAARPCTVCAGKGAVDDRPAGMPAAPAKPVRRRPRRG